MVHCSMGASVRYAVTSSQLGSTMAKTSAASAPSTYSAPRSTFVFGIGSGRFSAGTEKSESMPRSAPTGSTFESPAGLSIASNARSSRALTPARGPWRPPSRRLGRHELGCDRRVTRANAEARDRRDERRVRCAAMTRGTGPDARPGRPRVASRRRDCRSPVERVFRRFRHRLHVFRQTPFSPCGPQRLLARGSVEGEPVSVGARIRRGGASCPWKRRLEAYHSKLARVRCSASPSLPDRCPLSTRLARESMSASRARVGARGRWRASRRLRGYVSALMHFPRLALSIHQRSRTHPPTPCVSRDPLPGLLEPRRRREERLGDPPCRRSTRARRRP